MIEFLTFVATVATAIIAANIAKQANKISGATLRLEADKLLIEWTQRTIRTLSGAVALRLLSEKHTTAAAFKEKRRDLRAEMFTLLDEGKVLLRQPNGSPLPPMLAALERACNALDGRTFEPPKEGDYDQCRAPKINILRQEIRTITDTAQSLISNEWFTHSG